MSETPGMEEEIRGGFEVGKCTHLAESLSLLGFV